MNLPFAKPAYRKGKARKRREERETIKAIRGIVADRDGHCRLYWLDALSLAEVQAVVGPCFGRSEWAHIGDMRRSHTVGQAPKSRHTTTGTIMLCECHHRTGPAAYDLHRMEIDALTDDGCDGPLRFTRDGKTWEEPE